MDYEKEWLSRLEGKTITAVRPVRDIEGSSAASVPSVIIRFSDGTEFMVTPRPGVYFEGCLINTLRKAQPVTRVDIIREGMDTLISVESATFPLLMLTAINKNLQSSEFPFVLSERKAGVLA